MDFDITQLSDNSASELYTIHEKIIKTDQLINLVKDKTKKCNKIEKLYANLLKMYTELEAQYKNSEANLNDCVINHTPLEIEIKELRKRCLDSEQTYNEYVNNSEVKYQTICQELEELKKSQKLKLKAAKGSKNDLQSKIDDLSIELELTKSELSTISTAHENEKAKIINKYEYEKKILNDKINSLNSSNNNITKDVVSLESLDISFNTSNLPLLSNSICESNLNENKKELVSFCTQTDDFLCDCKQNSINIQKKSFNSVEIQTENKLITNSSQTYYSDICDIDAILNEMTETNELLSPLSPINDDVHIDDINEKISVSVGSDVIIPNFVNLYTQTNLISTNDISIQTDLKITVDSISQTESLSKVDIKVKTCDSSCQTETLKLQINDCNSQIQPLKNLNFETESLSKVDLKVKTCDSSCQTETLKLQINDCNSQIQPLKNLNFETKSLSKVDLKLKTCDSSCQTESINPIKPINQINSSTQTDLITQTQFLNSATLFKMKNNSYESDLNLKMKLNKRKIAKIYKFTKNKLLSNLKNCNLNLKKILQQYILQGNKPIVFVSPSLLKTSKLHDSNPEMYQNKIFPNNFSFSNFNSSTPNVNSLSCSCHNQFLQRNYIPCVPQCNLCNACNNLMQHHSFNSCNHILNRHIQCRNKITPSSSDSERDDNLRKVLKRCKKKVIREYYKNQFLKTERQRLIRKHFMNNVTRFPSRDNSISNIRLNSLKREAKTTDTDSLSDYNQRCRKKMKYRRILYTSSDSDDDISSHKSEYISKSKLRNPISFQNQSVKEISNTDNNCDTITLDNNVNDKTIVNSVNLDIDNSDNIVKETTSCNNNNKELLIRKEINNSINKKQKVEKPSKIKKLRATLNKKISTKKPILTETNISNVPIDYKKQKNDLFGSSSDSNNSSDDNLDGTENKIKKPVNKISIPKFNPIKIVSPIKDLPNEKIELNKETNESQDVSSNKSIVYKKPERRKIVSMGPLSPEPCQYQIVNPKIIPLDKLDTKSESSEFINQTIDTLNINESFQSEKEESFKVENTKMKNASKIETRFIKKMISDVATMDWDKDLLTTVASALSSQDALEIVNLLVNEAAQDFSQDLDKSFTPPAPLLTVTQQKLLVLLNRLENEGLTNIKSKFLVLAERRILCEKCINSVQSLTRLYVAVCKLKYDLEGVRMFCINAAYYMGDLFLPIMFIVLTMWGDVLPMASEDVPLAITLVHVIQSKTCRTPGYNVANLNRLLSDYYEYKRGEKTDDQIFNLLLSSFIDTQTESTFTAILILCKNFNTKWRLKMIKTNLIPLVNKYRSNNEKTELLSKMVNLVNRIKDMFHPINDKEHIIEVKNLLETNII